MTPLYDKRSWARQEIITWGGEGDGAAADGAGQAGYTHTHTLSPVVLTMHQVHLRTYV